MMEVTEDEPTGPASVKNAELVVGNILSDILDQLEQHSLPQMASETIIGVIVVSGILAEILDGIGHEQSDIGSGGGINNIISDIWEEVCRDEEACQIKTFFTLVW
jgi:hypothetical protein